MALTPPRDWRARGPVALVRALAGRWRGGAGPGAGGYAAALAALTFSLLPLRLYAALRLGYGDAEALYACYALQPQAAYRDHPGLIGLMGRALSDTSAPAPVRAHVATALALTALPFVAAACARACGARRERAPLAGLALVAAPEISVGLFGWTPDLPLAFAWLTALGLGGHLLQKGPDAPRSTAPFVALGLALGLGAAAKASGALLPVALALTLAAPPNRAFLRRPGPWLALAACLLVVSPVVWHELSRGLPMLRHRFVDTQARAGLSLRNLGAFVGGQLAYVSPPLLAGAWLAARSLRARAPRDPTDRWLYNATIVPAFALGALCLWSRVAEPHWFAPALLALPLAEARAPSAPGRLARAALGVGLALSLFVHAWVLTDLAPRLLGRLYVARYDLANDMLTWPRALPALSRVLARWRYDELSPPAVLTPHWTLAAQIYAGVGPDVAVGTLGGGPDDFRDWLPAGAWQGRPWVVWVNDDRRPPARPAPLDGWATLEEHAVVIERGGRPARRVVFQVLGRPGGGRSGGGPG
ncbi:MAG TPA: glycosyltransferase family 39 protein [Polyangiaceae bacterium]|nr:glycosyltransferase family 39 protein [Polyangiaceae bacterium]